MSPASLRRPAVIAALALALGLLAVPRSLDAADSLDREVITGGGGRITFGESVPGLLAIDDDTAAITLVADGEGKTLAAASSAGDREGEPAGRVVAFTHGSLLKGGKLFEQNAVAGLLVSAIRWAGRSDQPVVGLHPSLKDLATLLETAGCEPRFVAPGEVPAASVDVYCLIGQPGSADDRELDQLAAFAAGGGGLVVAATPWAFADRYPEFDQFPGNRLLATSSIRFLPRGYASRDPEPVIGGPLPPRPGDALPAARRLSESWESLGPEERDQLMSAVEAGSRLTGEAMPRFLAALLELNHAIGPVIPTQQTPIRPETQPILARLLKLENQLNQSLPAGVMYAIPAAADYPGAVPADAERVSHTLALDATYRGWLSGRPAGHDSAKEMRPTGIYALPGETVTVTLPAELAGQGFEIVIGSYRGSIERKDVWRRHLELQTRFAVEGPETAASNGLGGLVNILIPKGADFGDVIVRVDGGVRAPLFVEGETGLDEWRRTIRHYPGPWAEIAGKRMILALPSDHIHELDDPDEVTAAWNAIIDSCAELVGVDRDPYRAERVVFDRQISAGGMHSGYPFAAHIGDSSRQAVDSAALKAEGNWGFFHELGHNHQHNLWALPGTGETTCNLWSVYVFEEWVGKHRDQTHRAISPLNRRQRITEYFRKGADFEAEWSVWTALETYLQIQEKFGWEPFTATFREYTVLPEDDWPQTQQQKNDQFVIRLSQATGHNLAPFWRTWGLPLSDSVHVALAHLPAWEDHPVARFATE